MRNLLLLVAKVSGSYPWLQAGLMIVCVAFVRFGETSSTRVGRVSSALLSSSLLLEDARITAFEIETMYVLILCFHCSLFSFSLLFDPILFTAISVLSIHSV